MTESHRQAVSSCQLISVVNCTQSLVADFMLRHHKFVVIQEHLFEEE